MEEKRRLQAPVRGGLSAKGIIIPAALIILCLHALIIFNTLRINRIGEVISQTMRTSFSYSQVAKEFERGTDTLTDTARLYVSTGEEAYLSRYFSETAAMNDRDDALGRMISNSQDGKAYAEIAEAIRVIQDRTQMDYKALRLCADTFDDDLSDYPQLAQLSLSAEEAALSPAEKQSAAAILLSSADYLKTRTYITEHVDNAIALVSARTSQNIGEYQATLNRYRTLQWIVTAVIILVLMLMSLMLFIYLVSPLEQYLDEVERGDVLPTNKGLLELRHMASSYNELLYHRRMLENDLRSQSQTDALTGLPNRLAFENYITRLNWQNTHKSVTVFSLDVNGLKEKNDTKGHAYGDELLRDAAACILAAFGDETGKNCFRFGGDEFAAFWVDRPKADIAVALQTFAREQDVRGVSISAGYAYADDLSKTTVDTLFELADKSMYEEKSKLKHVHPLDAG